MPTQADLDQFNAYLATNPFGVAPPAPVADNTIATRVGKQLADVPSNALNSLLASATAVTVNAGQTPQDQVQPWQIPKPYDLPAAKTSGEQWTDLLAGKVAPTLAASLLPFGAISKGLQAAGSGAAVADVLANVGTGAFMAAPEGGEAALHGAVAGGIFSGLMPLSRIQRAVPAAALSYLDYNMSTSEGAPSDLASKQAAVDFVLAQLPGQHSFADLQTPDVVTPPPSEPTPINRAPRGALRLEDGSMGSGPTITPQGNTIIPFDPLMGQGNPVGQPYNGLPDIEGQFSKVANSLALPYNPYQIGDTVVHTPTGEQGTVLDTGNGVARVSFEQGSNPLVRLSDLQPNPLNQALQELLPAEQQNQSQLQAPLPAITDAATLTHINNVPVDQLSPNELQILQGDNTVPSFGQQPVPMETPVAKLSSMDLLTQLNQQAGIESDKPTLQLSLPDKVETPQSILQLKLPDRPDEITQPSANQNTPETTVPAQSGPKINLPKVPEQTTYGEALKGLGDPVLASHIDNYLDQPKGNASSPTFRLAAEHYKSLYPEDTEMNGLHEAINTLRNLRSPEDGSNDFYQQAQDLRTKLGDIGAAKSVGLNQAHVNDFMLGDNKTGINPEGYGHDGLTMAIADRLQSPEKFADLQTKGKLKQAPPPPSEPTEVTTLKNKIADLKAEHQFQLEDGTSYEDLRGLRTTIQRMQQSIDVMTNKSKLVSVDPTQFTDPQTGAVDEPSNPMMKKGRDKGGFVQTHLLSTASGAIAGGLYGYSKHKDPGEALMWATIGGFAGTMGYKMMEAMARANTRIHLKESGQAAKDIKTEIGSAFKAAADKPLHDIAGEDVRSRGGVMAKFGRAMEVLGEWGKPRDINTSWTQAHGAGAAWVELLGDKLRQMRDQPTPKQQSIDAGKRFIEGRGTNPADFKLFAKKNGGMTEDDYLKIPTKQRPDMVQWSIDGGQKGTTELWRLPKSARDQLMINEENIFTSAIHPDDQMFGKMMLQARRSQDGLSNMFAEGLPDGQAKNKILNGIGQYVARTYRIFTDPTYRPTDAQIDIEMKRQAAFLDAKGEIYDDHFLRAKTESLIQEYKQMGKVYRGSGKDTLDMNLVDKRLSLDPTFRELLGEITDPKERMLESINRIHPSASASRFISLVSSLKGEDGLPFAMDKDEWIKQSKKLDADMLDAKQKGQNDKFADLQTKRTAMNAMVDMSNNPKYGILKNSKVNRYVSDQMTQYDGPWGMFEAPAGRGIAAVNNIVKQTHAKYNPLNILRNYATLPIFLSIGRASIASTRQAIEALRLKNGDYLHMIHEGVLDADQVHGEFKSSMQDQFAGFHDSDLGKKFRQFDSAVGDLYRQPDLIIRAATYLEARSRTASEMNLPVDHPDVIRKAIEFTDRRTFNYANISPAVRIARNVPFFNLYISYQAEIARIAKNLFADGIKGDVHALAHLGAIAAIPEIVQAMARNNLSPEDRKKWDQAIRLSPDYNRSAYRYVTGKDANGNFKYIDFTPFVVHDSFSRSLKSIAQGDWKGLAEVNPLMGWDNTPAFNIISEQVTGKDQRTERQFRDFNDRLNSFAKEVSPNWTPGIGWEWQRSTPPEIGGTLGTQNLRTGRQDDISNVLFRYGTFGLNSTSINAGQVVKSAQSDMLDHIATEKAYLNDVLKTKGMPQTKKDAAVERYQQAVKTIVSTFSGKLTGQ